MHLRRCYPAANRTKNRTRTDRRSRQFNPLCPLHIRSHLDRLGSIDAPKKTLAKTNPDPCDPVGLLPSSLFHRFLSVADPQPEHSRLLLAAAILVKHASAPLARLSDRCDYDRQGRAVGLRHRNSTDRRSKPHAKNTFARPDGAAGNSLRGGRTYLPTLVPMLLTNNSPNRDVPNVV